MNDANPDQKSSLISDLRASIRGTNRDFTTGDIRKSVLLISVPMILEMSMQAILEFVDMLFVGRLGADAIAAVGYAGALVVLIFAIGIGFSMAATAIVARRIGEKNTEGAGRAAVHASILTIIVSVPFSLLGVFWAPELLDLMGASVHVNDIGSSYLSIIFAGNITITLLFVINACYRGAGDPSMAMRALFIANMINIILDPILIFGFGPIQAMGIEGAAIATVIGRGVGILYQLNSLRGSEHHLKITRDSFIYDSELMRQLTKLSLPAIVQFLIGTASWLAVVRLVSIFGDIAVAGAAVGVRVIIFTVLPSWGLANAAATLVGQSLGANKPDRATQAVYICARYNMSVLFVVMLAVFMWAPAVVGLITDDANVIREGVICLRVIVIGYVPKGLGIVMTQAFNGAGDTRTPTWINFVSLWVFQLPAAYLLSTTFGMATSGVYLGAALSQYVLAAVSFMMFRTGKWKRTDLTSHFHVAVE